MKAESNGHKLITIYVNLNYHFDNKSLYERTYMQMSSSEIFRLKLYYSVLTASTHIGVKKQNESESESERIRKWN